MRVTPIENGVEILHAGLRAEVHTYDQYATVWHGERPAGTLQRARHNERNRPEWAVYDTDGGLVFEFNVAARCVRKLAEKLGL